MLECRVLKFAWQTDSSREIELHVLGKVVVARGAVCCFSTIEERL
jgi:hypothetical protein